MKIVKLQCYHFYLSNDPVLLGRQKKITIFMWIMTIVTYVEKK